MTATQLPAIPRPQELATSEQVRRMADTLVAWAADEDDIGALRDATAKWAAVTEYVRRTTREGVAAAEAALRRMEIRTAQLMWEMQDAGELAGRGRPAVSPEKTSAAPTFSDLGIQRQDAAEMRLMANNVEHVEQIIADSTDASPPTRKKVVQGLRKLKREADNATVIEAEQRKHDALVAKHHPNYDAAADNARQKVLASYSGTIAAILRFCKTTTPEQVIDALDNTFPHVADQLRAEATEAIDLIRRYKV